TIRPSAPPRSRTRPRPLRNRTANGSTRGASAMNRSVAILTLSLCLLPGPLAAQELPHMEFVRRLREKNYPDLALEYLEKLGKAPAAATLPALPLELARTRLERARGETDQAKLLAVYALARTELEEFLAKNPQHPRAVEAEQELARI